MSGAEGEQVSIRITTTTDRKWMDGWMDSDGDTGSRSTRDTAPVVIVDETRPPIVVFDMNL